MPARGVTRRTMSRPIRALILGGLTAVSGMLLGLLPFALHLEESVGLDLLFTLRGARTPPADVVVVSTDKQSAEDLGLPADPAKWPRSLHARLTDTLTRRGAAVIVFDLIFEQPRIPEDDQAFADAIRRARNVILAQYLTRESVPLPGKTGEAAGHLTIERLAVPLPLLAESALAVAPFPLPKVPVKVSQYWAFKPDAGDAPTLPVMALQAFVLDTYDSFLRLFEQVSPYHAERLPRDRESLLSAGHGQQFVRLVREILQHEPAAAEQMLERLRTSPPASVDTRQRHALTALLHMYRGPATLYLNYYGPARTITTVRYHQALDLDLANVAAAPAPELRGKAVFVGLADHLQPFQRDGFYTVFSQSSGSDLSGVEIAATAFANLLDMTPVEPLTLGFYVATLLLWGFGVGALARLLPTPAVAPSVLAMGLLYLLAVKYRFQVAGYWYPLVVPLFVQIPVAILGSVAWSHFETHRERQNIRRALGYYLPARVADEVVKHIGDLRSRNQLVYGTCLSTDAHQYTSLAESMDPRELGVFMNQYYAAIFEPVKRYGGIVQDVVGDSMLAIWATTQPDAALRRQACLAALDIAGAVDRFNKDSGSGRLPIRIGLHSGQMLLGHVGAIDHYEYRAVGDIVNVATRLEGLNKHLGTRILATEEVLQALDGFLARGVGAFRLVGKSKAVVVDELICRDTDATAELRARCARFADALVAYRNQSWKEAIGLFQEVIHASGGDGPSAFYVRLCERCLESPPGESWDGVVYMDSK